jgi:hypothetical protein
MDKCGKPSNAINDEYDVVTIATSIVNPGVFEGENVTNTVDEVNSARGTKKTRNNK